MTKKRITKHGTMRHVVAARPSTKEPEKAEITVEGADPLYREIRIGNSLEKDGGGRAKLTLGEKLEVIIEAEAA